MEIFDHCASQLFQRVALLHSSGLRLCYWILLCASRVYKSKKFWLASNVSLVESESCAPLIPLVGELMDSKVISTARSECVVARLLKISKTPGRKCILIRAKLTKANFWYLATALIKACVIEACRAVRNNILSPFFDENKKRFLVKF